MLWCVSVAPLGAPVVPLVNWMLIGSSNCERALELCKPRAMAFAAHRGHVGKAEKAALFVVADADQRGQMRQPLRLQAARRAAVDLGRELAQHADIVAGLERIGGDQRLAADLVERVFELGQPVGRVDVDQDQAGLGGGELGDHPFGIVRRPDADAIAGRKPEREQAGGERVDPRLQCGIGPANILVAHDQRVAVAPARRRPVEMHANRVADQRRGRDAVAVALRQFRHDCSPGKSRAGRGRFPTLAARPPRPPV